MNSRFPQPIILASRSPRRQELLQQIGVNFELYDIEIDESVLPGEAPQVYVERMAREKAGCAWRKMQAEKTLNSSTTILAADTSVILGDKILGKPVDQKAAKKLLQQLSNQPHQVITSVALASGSGVAITTSITQVTFGELSESLIDQYIATGEGMDKAGSYGIQGMAAQFVKSISGSYSGVVGLPLYETSQLLDKHFKG